jgi:cytosine/uracil/thiamine/allantoin permease
MPVGCKRTLFGRISAVLGFACGIIGLVAGLTDHTWKLWPIGWFTGGALLTLVALVALVDAAIASSKPR